MTEDLGTPTRPHALTGEQWRLEVRTDDPPSPADDERWIRSDLDSRDRVATLKCGDGTEIPLFATGTAEDTVREARRFHVGGQTVYAPLAPVDEAAYPARRVQHAGEVHAYHDRVAPGSATPDSAVHRWAVSNGSGTTLTESLNGDDGVLSTDAMWTSGTWIDGYALNGDGTDDYVETTTLSQIDFRDLTQNWWFAFTIQTTDGSDQKVFGESHSGANASNYLFAGIQLQSDFQSTTPGRPSLGLRDDDGDVVIHEADQAVDDGNKYRIVANKTANSGSFVDWYINGSSVSGSVITDQRDGFTNPSGDFSNPVRLLAGSEDSGITDHLNGTVDDLILGQVGTTLSSDEITDDYNRQPWS